MSRVLLTVKDDGEWKKLDMFEVANVELQYSIKDVKEIDKRNSSFSYNFSLPSTDTNDRFFKYYYNVNSLNGFNPNAKVQAYISASSGETLLNGYLRLSSVATNADNEIQYSVVVFGATADIYKSLGDKLMVGNEDAEQDLYWNNLPTTIDRADIVDSWDNNADDGICFPLLDYYKWGGGKWSNAGIQVSEVKPQLFVKTILDKMFERVGFKYESDFINSDFFKSLFLLNVNGVSTVSNLSVTNVSHSVQQAFANDGAYHQVLFDTEPTGSDPHSQYNPSTSEFTATDDGIYEFVMYFEENLNCSRAAAYDFYIDIGGAKSQIGTIWASYTKTANLDIIWNYTATHKVKLNSGDVVKFYIKYKTGATALTLAMDKAILTVNQSNIFYTDGYRTALPFNVKQKDFFNDICKMFNLYLEPSLEDPTLIYIEPRDDYYGMGNKVDWSSKIDFSQPYTIYPLTEEAYTDYQFKHVPNGCWGEQVEILKERGSSVNFGNGKVYYGADNFPDQKAAWGDTKISINAVNSDKKVKEIKMSVLSGRYLTTSGDNFGSFFSVDENYDYKETVLKPAILSLAVGKTVENGSFYTNYAVLLGSTGSMIATTEDTPPLPYLANICFDPVRGGANKPSGIDPYNYNRIDMLAGDSVNPTSRSYAEIFYLNEIRSLSNPDARKLNCKIILEPSDVSSLRMNDSFWLVIGGEGAYWRLTELKYNPTAEQAADATFIRVDDLKTEPQVVKNYSSISDKYASNQA